MRIGYDKSGAPVEISEEQERFLYRFRQALLLDLDEGLIAEQVMAIHNELNRNQELYREVWFLIDSAQRAAIKKYIYMARYPGIEHTSERLI